MAPAGYNYVFSCETSHPLPLGRFNLEGPTLNTIRLCIDKFTPIIVKSVTVDLGDVTVLAQLPTSDATSLSAGTRVRLSMRRDPVLIARDEKVSTEA